MKSKDIFGNTKRDIVLTHSLALLRNRYLLTLFPHDLKSDEHAFHVGFDLLSAS